MALCQTRLTSVLLPFLDRPPVYRLRTPRYTPRHVPFSSPSLSRCVLPRDARAIFTPRIERVTKHPSLSRRNPFCHRSPAVFQIPLVPISRHDSRDARDIHRPCKRYSIFRLAASRMLNTKATLLHVCIYIYIYVSSERRKEFRGREHWLNRALTHRQIAIRKSSRLRS